jgi:aspartate aminotransferase-like enzyme
MGYSAQRQNVLLCLAALEAVLGAEGWKSEPGAGVEAAAAYYDTSASAGTSGLTRKP